MQHRRRVRVPARAVELQATVAKDGGWTVRTKARDVIQYAELESEDVMMAVTESRLSPGGEELLGCQEKIAGSMVRE